MKSYKNMQDGVWEFREIQGLSHMMASMEVLVYCMKKPHCHMSNCTDHEPVRGAREGIYRLLRSSNTAHQPLWDPTRSSSLALIYMSKAKQIQ